MIAVCGKIVNYNGIDQGRARGIGAGGQNDWRRRHIPTMEKQGVGPPFLP